LPEAAPDVPVTYDDAELALLEGSSILARVRHERDLFRRQYDALRAARPDAADYSFDDYLRFRTLVPSRAFAILGTEALVPMADMLNHRRVPDVEWGYEHPTESFVMRATHDIAAGEAVHDSYGQKSNGLLFEIYGFCADDTNRHEAEIRLMAIDPGHPLAGGTSTFGRSVDGQRAFRVASALDRGEESAAITYLRRALGDSAPLEATDDRVCRAMIDACDRALAAFPAAAHDDVLLASPTLGDRARKCLHVRGGERSVLSAVRARYERASFG
jgi:histone-lysine N-methyltransferase SETD3